MRIGVDISQLAYPGSGVWRYTHSLVEQLLTYKEHEFVLFYSSLRQPLTINFDTLIKRYFFPPSLLEFLWNRLHVLPIESLVGDIDVFHSSDWVEPPTRCPKVTTVHDLVVYKYPESLPKSIVETHKRKLEWVVKESAFIVADSVSTKHDLMDVLHVDEKRIRVVYPGVDTRFKSSGREAKPYFLCVGTIEPRKNLTTVFEAFSQIAKEFPDYILIVAGKIGWKEKETYEMVKKLGIEKQVKFRGYVTDKELVSLYQQASCFVYPSVYEGFGLPILEAMACGVPVVASDSSSLPELGGDVSYYASYNDSAAFARQMKTVITLTYKEREALSRRCIERARTFSWERTAREMMEVYHNACRN